MGLHVPTRADAASENARKPLPRLMIVSETRLFGEGLAEALGRDGAIMVCGHCASPVEALARLVALKPDVVLLDAAVQGGFTLVASMGQAMPQLPIVVIAVADIADSVIAWAEVGVAGYIPQTVGLCEVVPILLGIMAGEQVCSRSVAAGLFRRLRDLRSDAGATRGSAPKPALTEREWQIVDLIDAGLSNKQIARQLNIGVATAKSHVHNLLGKLDVRRRGEIAPRLRMHRGVGVLQHSFRM